MKKSVLMNGVGIFMAGLSLSAVFLAPEASAAPRALNCVIGQNQGSAKIEVYRVEEHPELSVFKVQMAIKPVRKLGNGDSAAGEAHLSGLMTAQIGNAHVFASGLMFNLPDSYVVINPELITLQGNVRGDGSLVLSLLDTDRVLQLGYGVTFFCR